jgi:hypothetical protein
MAKILFTILSFAQKLVFEEARYCSTKSSNVSKETLLCDTHDDESRRLGSGRRGFVVPLGDGCRCMANNVLSWIVLVLRHANAR